MRAFSKRRTAKGWNGRGELVCPLRGQSLESRLAAQPGVRPTEMVTTGRVGQYHWAEVDGEQADIRDVVRALSPHLRGMRAVNVSWDSGKMHEIGIVPAKWTVQGEHAVSPPLEDAILEAWPQSECNSGRYDEWYFFRTVPGQLRLQALCNWATVHLQEVAELAYPGGFDLAAQLALAEPEIVIGDGAGLYVIAKDESASLELRNVEYKPHEV